MPRPQTINVPLLKKVRALVLREPERVDQTWWLQRLSFDDETTTVVPQCGTVGCIAGHAVMLTYPSARMALDVFWASCADEVELRGGRRLRVSETARKVLRLDEAQADELFCASAADGVPGTKAHARAVAKHITAFIKKHGPKVRRSAVRA